MTKSVTQKRNSGWVEWIFSVGLVLTISIMLLLGKEVASDLERQRSAGTDNIQWTLTQLEVEYLSFLNALEHYGHVKNDETPMSLQAVRQQFDVFYSRVDLLQTSPLFADLRQDEEFNIPMMAVLSFLDKSVSQIDSSNLVLDLQIGAILDLAVSINQDVRDLSISGLSYFARVSDKRRLKTANTLFSLAALSGGLFLVLAGLSIYLLFVNQKTRQRSDQLKQTYQRMNTVLSTSLDAVIVVNSAGSVLEFNPAAETIFGRTFAEAKGKSIGDLIVPAHLREAHSAGIARMSNGGKCHVVGKGRVQLDAIRANGEIFPVELALQSAFDGQEEIVIGFVRDISRQVADQKELISARDQALAGEKAKADFLTVMSHEFRTPLNGLLGNLSILGNSHLSEQQHQFVHNMEISGQVLLNHVDTVLDIARFEAGKLLTNHEPLDLNVLLQDLVDSQAGNAASRGNVIEWRWMAGANPWVKTDQQRLRQILLNLVGNAIKFTENGHISIEVEEIEFTEGQEIPTIEFRVIDTGVGIRADDAELVFDDFHTHDPSIGRATEGTGLGLGIARRFTQAMKGEIGVESEPNKGSVFWVRLPLEPADATVDIAPPAALGTPAKKLDLLVVEDNEINLEVLRNILELDGHKITEAMDGKSGVDEANMHRFDAILMDISMPVMDGATASRHIRSGSGLSSDVPILAVSANVLPDAVDGFREAGMNAFIRKPISIKALRKALSVLSEASESQTVSSTESAHDQKQLATLQEQLGEETFVRLLGRFITEADTLVADISLDWKSTDSAQLAASCHKLAGSAAIFGAVGMHNVLIQIENAARADDIELVSSTVSQLDEVWARTLKGLPKLS